MSEPAQPSINRETSTGASEISSFASLLEHGLTCFRQGRDVEAISIYAQARKQLTLEQAQYAAVIDAFIENYDHYQQAQSALQLASRLFVEAENTQQALLLRIEKLLSDLGEAGPTTLFQSSYLTGPSHSEKEAGAIAFTQPSSSHQKGIQSSQSTPVLIKEREIYTGHDAHTLPALYITCFGHFEVWRDSHPVALCQNRNGQAILRYLVAQHGYRASMDTLMGTLWPDNDPDIARHKVQIAVSALRHSLNKGITRGPGGGYILCKNSVYMPNPAAAFSTDVDEFLQCYQAGRQSSHQGAITHYERACHLYRGTFLAEDIYMDWTFVRRDQLSQQFLNMCHALITHYLATERFEEAIQWANAILEENCCDEEAYRQLIQAYMASGRRSDALRQFRRCEQVLYSELGVSPLPETINLFQSLTLSHNRLAQDNANREKIE